MHKILFYNKFIICLYMFRALYAHHQEVKIALYSIWYHKTCRWPSRARDGHLQVLWYQMLYRVIQNDWLSWRVNGSSTHTRQLVAVLQALCSLYELICVGYAQNSLEFASRSPLIHAKILCCIVAILFSTDAAARLALGEHSSVDI